MNNRLSSILAGVCIVLSGSVVAAGNSTYGETVSLTAVGYSSVKPDIVRATFSLQTIVKQDVANDKSLVQMQERAARTLDLLEPFEGVSILDDEFTSRAVYEGNNSSNNLLGFGFNRRIMVEVPVDKYMLVREGIIKVKDSSLIEETYITSLGARRACQNGAISDAILAIQGQKVVVEESLDHRLVTPPKQFKVTYLSKPSTPRGGGFVMLRESDSPMMGAPHGGEMGVAPMAQIAPKVVPLVPPAKKLLVKSLECEASVLAVYKYEN